MTPNSIIYCQDEQSNPVTEISIHLAFSQKTNAGNNPTIHSHKENLSALDLTELQQFVSVTKETSIDKMGSSTLAQLLICWLIIISIFFNFTVLNKNVVFVVDGGLCCGYFNCLYLGNAIVNPKILISLEGEIYL